MYIYLAASGLSCSMRDLLVTGCRIFFRCDMWDLVL